MSQVCVVRMNGDVSISAVWVMIVSVMELMTAETVRMSPTSMPVAQVDLPDLYMCN